MTPFELALQKRKQQDQAKSEADKLKSQLDYSKDREHIEWMGIDKSPKAFRIIGNPVEVRETPFDPKIVYWSKIISDNGKNWVNIYHPTQDDKLDSTWILNRLYESVTESEWHNWKEGELKDPNRPRSTDKGYYMDKHFGLPSYNRITQNKKENSKQFGHFRARKRVVLNVIDRMDDWCVQNKHTKILTSNYSPFQIKDENGETKTLFFNDVGISEQVYELFYSQVLEFRTHWDLDIIIRKEDKQTFVQDCFEDKIKPEIKKIIKLDVLSEEESKYERYDLDKLFKHSTYNKLIVNFSNLFKQVDIDLKTNYYDELKHLYEAEKIEKDKEQTQETKTVHPVDNSISSKTETVSTPKTEETTKTRRNVELTVPDKLKLLPCWNNLSDSDKSSMLDSCISVDGEKLSFKSGVSLVPCSCDKKVYLPDDVWVCPIDGTKFE